MSVALSGSFAVFFLFIGGFLALQGVRIALRGGAQGIPGSLLRGDLLQNRAPENLVSPDGEILNERALPASSREARERVESDRSDQVERFRPRDTVAVQRQESEEEKASRLAHERREAFFESALYNIEIQTPLIAKNLLQSVAYEVGRRERREQQKAEEERYQQMVKAAKSGQITRDMFGMAPAIPGMMGPMPSGGMSYTGGSYPSGAMGYMGGSYPSGSMGYTPPGMTYPGGSTGYMGPTYPSGSTGGMYSSSGGPVSTSQSRVGNPDGSTTVTETRTYSDGRTETSTWTEWGSAGSSGYGTTGSTGTPAMSYDFCKGKLDATSGTTVEQRWGVVMGQYPGCGSYASLGVSGTAGGAMTGGSPVAGCSYSYATDRRSGSSLSYASCPLEDRGFCNTSIGRIAYADLSVPSPNACASGTSGPTGGTGDMRQMCISFYAGWDRAAASSHIDGQDTACRPYKQDIVAGLGSGGITSPGGGGGSMPAGCCKNMMWNNRGLQSMVSVNIPDSVVQAKKEECKDKESWQVTWPNPNDWSRPATAGVPDCSGTGGGGGGMPGGGSMPPGCCKEIVWNSVGLRSYVSVNIPESVVTSKKEECKNVTMDRVSWPNPTDWSRPATAGVPDCTGSGPAMPPGGGSGMRNCIYNNAHMNGAPIREPVFCEGDYFRCRMQRTGESIPNAGLSLGAPTSCESGWSGGGGGPGGPVGMTWEERVMAAIPHYPEITRTSPKPTNAPQLAYWCMFPATGMDHVANYRAIRACMGDKVSYLDDLERSVGSGPGDSGPGQGQDIATMTVDCRHPIIRGEHAGEFAECGDAGCRYPDGSYCTNAGCFSPSKTLFAPGMAGNFIATRADEYVDYDTCLAPAGGRRRGGEEDEEDDESFFDNEVACFLEAGEGYSREKMGKDTAEKVFKSLSKGCQTFFRQEWGSPLCFEFGVRSFFELEDMKPSGFNWVDLEGRMTDVYGAGSCFGEGDEKKETAGNCWEDALDILVEKEDEDVILAMEDVAEENEFCSWYFGTNFLADGLQPFGDFLALIIADVSIQNQSGVDAGKILAYIEQEGYADYFSIDKKTLIPTYFLVESPDRPLRLAQEGEGCGGMPMPGQNSRECADGLLCVNTNPYIADAGGTCYAESDVVGLGEKCGTSIGKVCRWGLLCGTERQSMRLADAGVCTDPFGGPKPEPRPGGGGLAMAGEVLGRFIAELLNISADVLSRATDGKEAIQNAVTDAVTWGSQQLEEINTFISLGITTIDAPFRERLLTGARDHITRVQDLLIQHGVAPSRPGPGPYPHGPDPQRMLDVATLMVEEMIPAIIDAVNAIAVIDGFKDAYTDIIVPAYEEAVDICGSDNPVSCGAAVQDLFENKVEVMKRVFDAYVVAHPDVGPSLEAAVDAVMRPFERQMSAMMGGRDGEGEYHGPDNEGYGAEGPYPN